MSHTSQNHNSICIARIESNPQDWFTLVKLIIFVIFNLKMNVFQSIVQFLSDINCYYVFIKFLEELNPTIISC